MNDKDQGGYSDGFTPMNEPTAPGILQNGCYVVDDLSSPLGDVTDPMVAAALDYRVTSSCPVITQVSKDLSTGPQIFKATAPGSPTVNDDDFGSIRHMIRTMTDFKKKGLIEMEGRNIKIVDLEKLKHMY